jgi:hypothetical protein
MVNDDRSSTEQSTSQADQAPGGRSNRGPEFGTVGEPQVPTPPYDELRGEPGENTAPTAFDADNAPDPGPEPAVSDQERSGVSSTDMDPEPALGVGQSHGRRGEDLPPDREDEATKGPSQRPVGRTADDEVPRNSDGPTDPDGPRLQPGDQGG